jgi:hypothetical protein
MRGGRDAAGQAALRLDGGQHRRIEARPHPGAPAVRVEAADAVEIRAQHADGKVEERLEIRLPNRAEREARAHVIDTQNFWMRVQASRSASSEVA